MPPPSRRGVLSKALIVNRAVDLAREEGLTAVTMRRIAADLGVEAMSLYHHIPTKATLLVLMADWSLSRVPQPDPELGWKDQLVQLLLQTYLAGVENPLLYEVIASEPLAERQVPAADAETGAASAAFVDTVLALLDQSGLPLDRQVDAYRGLIALLIGFIVVRADGFLTTVSPPNRRGGARTGTDRNTAASKSAGDTRTAGTDRTAGTAAAGIAGTTTAENPSARASQVASMLRRSDPVSALGASLRWFLQGLTDTDPAPRS